MPAGVEIREGKTGTSLRITFTWQGQRRRETLNLPATPANIKYAANFLGGVKTAIEKGQFDYAQTFPGSIVAKNETKKRRYTVKELIDSYITHAKASQSLSPTTLVSYQAWANSRLNPIWGSRIADEIPTHELRTWITTLHTDLSPKSIRNAVGLLNAVLTRALADSAISVNPLAPISLKSVMPRQQAQASGENSVYVDPFNDAEIASILNALQTQEEKSLWQFAFASGLRTGELIALKWADILWGKNEIRVKDNIVSDEIGTIEKSTKTGTVRSIPILPAAREALDRMRPISEALSPFVFINPRTQRRWSDGAQMRERSWMPALKRAGIRYRVPYQTRHTFASRLLMAGEPALLVARLMGHTTTEMITRHYGGYIKQSSEITLSGDYASFGASSNAK